MSDDNEMLDLVVLAADGQTRLTIETLLKVRHRALSIKSIKVRVYVHNDHDDGCLRHGHESLGSFVHRARHALVVFDHDGCGREGVSRQEIEFEVEEKLRKSGWDDRAAAIVIDPELEAWVWTKSPHVSQALGWGADHGALWDWLAEQRFLRPGDVKPKDPKASLDAALKHTRKPRSSAIYQEIAEKVSVEGCRDPAFWKLRDRLTSWFPAEPELSSG